MFEVRLDPPTHPAVTSALLAAPTPSNAWRTGEYEW